MRDQSPRRPADNAAIELLVPWVMQPSEFIKNAAHALARIGGIRAAGALVDALIHPSTGLSDNGFHDIAESLQIGRFSALESVSRDRLVDWLSVNRDKRPPAYRHVLHALKNARLPRGAETVLSLVTDSAMERAVKEPAIALLSGVTDEQVLEQAAAYALELADEELRTSIWRALAVHGADGILEELAWSLVLDGTATLPQRSAVMDFLKRARQPIPRDRAKKLLASVLVAPAPVQKPLLRDAVQLLASKQPGWIPGLLRDLAGHKPPLPSGLKDQLYRVALKEAAAQGWLVFDDSVVDPTGRQIPSA